MKLKSLLLLLLSGMGALSYGQKTDYNKTESFLKANSVWTFGRYVGLDFNSSVPTPFVTELSSEEGSAAVADPVTGKLLFYSNGGDCWNANHQIMPNGSGLLGNGSVNNNVRFSSTQGVSIVPMIDSPGKYYLFSLNFNGNKPALYYSIVDMSLDNGMGDIVANRKNIILDTGVLSESMGAIPGDNCDIWLMTHAYDEPVFKAYHITKDGLDTVPVLSTTTGNLYGNRAYYIGGMAISPDRKKIAIGSYFALSLSPSANGALVAEFDPATGEVSNAIKVESAATYGLCFSPDNSKLYMTSTGNLYQFDLSNYDSASIVNSRTLIYGLGTGPNSLRLYNDTIYVSNKKDGNSIHRINRPNASGASCDFEAGAISLIAGHGCKSGLGSDVIAPIQNDEMLDNVFDTFVCLGESVVLKPAFASEAYLWSDGTDNQTNTVTQPGTYWVMYNEDPCTRRVDTFIIREIKLNPIIRVDERVLSTSEPFDTYQWMLNDTVIQGATESTYTVTENGDYRVIVSDEDGCMDTSDVYEINNIPSRINRMDDLSAQILIYPNPADDLIHLSAPLDINVTITNIVGKAIKSVDKAKSISVKELASGMYILQISDQDGRLIKIEKLSKN